MKNKFYFFCALILVMSCVKPPKYPKEPTIKYERMTKSIMKQDGVFNGDSTTITISFTDGDGDLGSTIRRGNAFFRDTRSTKKDTFTIPAIPQQGANNGVSGEISFTLYSSCCIYSNTSACFPNPNVPLDTMTYEIQILDEAGNVSNTIETTPIILRCE